MRAKDQGYTVGEVRVHIWIGVHRYGYIACQYNYMGDTVEPVCIIWTPTLGTSLKCPDYIEVY